MRYVYAYSLSLPSISLANFRSFFLSLNSSTFLSSIGTPEMMCMTNGPVLMSALLEVSARPHGGQPITSAVVIVEVLFALDYTLTFWFGLLTKLEKSQIKDHLGFPKVYFVYSSQIPSEKKYWPIAIVHFWKLLTNEGRSTRNQSIIFSNQSHERPPCHVIFLLFHVVLCRNKQIENTHFLRSKSYICARNWYFAIWAWYTLFKNGYLLKIETHKYGLIVINSKGFKGKCFEMSKIANFVRTTMQKSVLR